MNDLPSKMRALQLQGRGNLAEVELPLPKPNPNEVIVRTRVAIICTSDLNDIDHNPFDIALPRVLGHESSGVIVSAGHEVENLKVGDRAAVHPVIPCQNCSNCRRALGHLCSNMGHLGLDRDGTFSEYFSVPAACAFKIPDEMDFVTAALLEPVAVCLEAVQRGRIQKGETVLVVGDGPFGIIIARLASESGGGKIIVVGQHDFRLKQIGHAIKINEQNTPDVNQVILVANEGQGVGVAILAAGNQRALDICLAALRARGRLVVFSAIHVPAQVDLFRLHVKELEILGACNDENLAALALQTLKNSSRQFSSLVTHKLPFGDWREAFRLAGEARDQALKVAIVFPEAP